MDEMALALAKKGGWIGACCVTCDKHHVRISKHPSCYSNGHLAGGSIITLGRRYDRLACSFMLKYKNKLRQESEFRR